MCLINNNNIYVSLHFVCRFRSDSTRSEDDAQTHAAVHSAKRFRKMSCPEKNSGGTYMVGTAPIVRWNNGVPTVLSPDTSNPADLALLAKLDEENR